MIYYFLFMPVSLFFNPVLLTLFLIVALVGMCLSIVFLINTYFYSYLIFMLFISGVIIMLMYLCGILLIEKIFLGSQFYFVWVVVMIISLLLTSDWAFNWSGDLLGHGVIFYQEFYDMKNLLSYSFNFFTLFFIIYLFICLIIVYEIVKKCTGPLRVSS